MCETYNDIWLIDNGCNNRMKGNTIIITNLDDSVRNKVKLGTYNIVNVIEKRMVDILTKQSQKRHIPHVYYAPGLKNNLICVGRLIQKGKM
jgi:hypothetical protein